MELALMHLTMALVQLVSQQRAQQRVVHPALSAINYGGGALSITTTGITTGDNGAGIDARNWEYYGNTPTSLTINAATTTGSNAGIFADNDGTGALSITTSGTTKGTSSNGIYANNSATGTSLTINAEATTGTQGIKALNEWHWRTEKSQRQARLRVPVPLVSMRITLQLAPL